MPHVNFYVYFWSFLAFQVWGLSVERAFWDKGFSEASLATLVSRDEAAFSLRLWTILRGPGDLGFRV